MIPLIPSSFGDIVAAATIAHSIYQALKDSTGSSFEYQCLIDELSFFEDALSRVDCALKAIPLNELDRQSIQEEITRCYKLLRKFMGHIQKYEVVISGSKWYTSIWRKITWAILKPDEVASFRRKLSQHKNNIIVFLMAVEMSISNVPIIYTDTYNSYISVTNAGNADETRQGLSLVLHKLDVLQSRPSPYVRYDLGNALILIDALGEHVTLPMQLCFSQDVGPCIQSI